MLATKNDIIRFIPQRDPIIMVHNLIEASDDHAITQLYVSEDNVFASDGFMAEPGLIENIAQTAAVHVGFSCMQKGVPIPIGYIASIRNLRVHRVPELNSMLTTTVRITNKVLDVTVAVGEVTLNEEVLCSCEMRIFAKVQA